MSRKYSTAQRLCMTLQEIHTTKHKLFSDVIIDYNYNLFFLLTPPQSLKPYTDVY